MARSASFKTLVAYQECVSFAALIRSQESWEQGAAALTLEGDIPRAFGRSERPDLPHPSDPADKFLIPPLRPEPETKP